MVLSCKWEWRGWTTCHGGRQGRQMDDNWKYWKQCVGVVRKDWGKRRWKPKVNGWQWKGGERKMGGGAILVWVMDRAPRDEREEAVNLKLRMRPTRFQRRERWTDREGDVGDGLHWHHLGRNWNERKMGERNETDSEGKKERRAAQEREGRCLNQWTRTKDRDGMCVQQKHT